MWPKSSLEWIGAVSLLFGGAVMAIKGGDLPLRPGAPDWLASNVWSYVPITLFVVYILIAIYKAVRSAPGETADVIRATPAPIPMAPIKSQTLPADLPSTPRQERIFLADNVTIGFLISLCEGKTTVQAHRATAPYAGKWYRYTGSIDDVSTYHNTTVIRFDPDRTDILSVMIEGDTPLADILHIGDVITVIGRIKMIASTGIILEMGEVEAR